MLLLLPLLVFAAAFLLFLGREAGESGDLTGWGPAFIRAAIVWGALVVLFSEGLSLFHALRAGPLALLWGLGLIVFGGVLIRSGALRKLREARPRLAAARLTPVEVVFLLGLGAEVVILLAIAWRSPPNNTDSLAYHMSRVAHWAQAGAIVHYPTAYEPQLTHPIWAETAILHLRLLWGDDRPANLVQLFSMVGCWAAVASLGRLLGAGRRAQFLSVAFLASLPIGILEATSAQNDYVPGLWLAGLLYFALREHRQGLSRLDLGLAGLGLGLGLLTKGTFYGYGPVVAAWLLISRVRRGGWLRAVAEAAVVGGLAALLSLGFWARNYQTYRSPVGSQERLSGFVKGSYTPRTIVASWIENFALDLATPSEDVNSRMIHAIRGLRPQEGEEASQFGLVWAWNNDNLAGNPLHLGLAVLTAISLTAILIRRRDGEARLAAAYAATVLAATLFMFSILDFDLYGVRHQIPFFVAWAPIVGAVAQAAAKPRVTLAASLLLLLAGAPWVVLNASRPAIGMKPRTMIDSVFNETPRVILMASWSQLRDGYFGAADTVRESGCDRVGLRLDSHDLEYAYWWLLDAPQSGIRMENIDPAPHLERYADPEFRPCAIVCMVCGGRTRFHGLDRTFAEGEISVFLGSGYTTSED